jgi:hypothetical protein
MSGLDTSQAITDEASLHADGADEYHVHSHPEQAPDPDNLPVDRHGAAEPPPPTE